MSKYLKFASLAAAAFVLAGCPSSDKCKGVMCATGQTCDTNTGLCKNNGGGGGGTAGGTGGGTAGGTGGGTAGGTGGGTAGGTGGGGGGGGTVDAGPDVNDTCAGVIDFPLDGGTTDDAGVTIYQITVNLVPDHDDYKAVCDFFPLSTGAPSTQNDKGPDVVFRYHVAAPADISFTVGQHGTPTNGSDSVAYIGKAPCDNGTAPLKYTPYDSHSCTDVAANDPETVVLHNVQPQDLFLFVDNFCPASGSCAFSEPNKVSKQDVTLKISPPTVPPANDTCLGAVKMFADGGTSDTVTGSTANSYDDYQGSCQRFGGTFPDVTYGFHLASTQSVSFTAQPTAGSQFVPMIYIVNASDCNADGGVIDGQTATYSGCTYAPGFGASTNLTVESLPAGDYLLVVDTWYDNSDVPTATATPAIPTGSFTVTGTIGAVKTSTTANSSCATALPLTLTDLPDYPGTASIVNLNGTTVGAGYGHNIDCSALGALPDGGFGTVHSIGPDIAYSFTSGAAFAPDAGNFYVMRATVISDNFDTSRPELFFEQTCGNNNPDAGLFSCEQGFDFGYYISNQALIWSTPAPVTPYTLWVDSSDLFSDAGTPGPFELEVQLASKPANDNCTGAVTLPFNVTHAGTTVGANNDYDDTGVVSTSCASMKSEQSADVVYKIHSASTNPITVTVLPEKFFNVGVYVLDACANSGGTPGTCKGGADTFADGVQETFTFTPAANTDYFVVVDGPLDLTDMTIAGFYGARGGFTIGATQQ